MIEFAENPDSPEGAAIVFGGPGGLGQSIARGSWIGGRGGLPHTWGEAESVVRQIENQGGNAIAVRADLSDPGSIADATDGALGFTPWCLRAVSPSRRPI